MTEMHKTLQERLPKLLVQTCSFFPTPPSAPLFLKLYQTHQVLSHENLLWLEKLFFFQFIAKTIVTKTEMKKTLFTTKTKVCMLNIIQSISQRAT